MKLDGVSGVADVDAGGGASAEDEGGIVHTRGWQLHAAGLGGVCKAEEEFCHLALATTEFLQLLTTVTVCVVGCAVAKHIGHEGID